MEVGASPRPMIECETRRIHGQTGHGAFITNRSTKGATRSSDRLNVADSRPMPWGIGRWAEVARMNQSMQVLQGIAVSPGVAIGEALVMGHEGFRIPRRFVARDAVEHELDRLDRAIAAAGDEIQRNRDAVSGELGDQYAANSKIADTLAKLGKSVARTAK